MFTLPIDRKIAEQPVIPGKVYQDHSWDLKIRIQPGVVKNSDTWIPGADHVRFLNRDLQLEICLGDQVLTKSQLTKDPIELHTVQVDTVYPVRQLLTVTLTGYPAEQDLDNNQHAGIVLEMSINNLSILNILEAEGQYRTFNTNEVKCAGSVMGENGKQTLEIYTPIYAWLLQHQKHIYQYYKSPRADIFK